MEGGALLIPDHLPPSLAQGRTTNLQEGVLIMGGVSEGLRPCKNRNTEWLRSAQLWRQACQGFPGSGQFQVHPPG